MANKKFRNVVLAGASASAPERAVLGQSYRQYLANVVKDALATAHLTTADIQIGAISYNERNITEGALGSVVADALGMSPIPFVSLSQACPAGGICADIIWNYIGTGRYDVGIVLGINKPDNFDFRDAMGPIGNWCDFDYMLGFTHENYGALRGEYYKLKYGYDDKAAAKWSYQCHWYARKNPMALHNSGPLPTDDELNEQSPAGYRMRTATGRNMATCLILMSEEKAKKLGLPQIYINVSYMHRPVYIGNHYFFQDKNGNFSKYDMADQPAIKLAAEEAYEIAGIKPEDIDIAQVHDLSLYDGIMAMEWLGICQPGKGGHFVLDGQTAIEGKCPTNTDGGAIAFAHSSAGGDFQSKAYENWLQLLGKAGERQVKNPKVTVAHAYGTHHSLDVVGVVRKG
ncbi:MAG: thiolase family protein [Planctomycetes bacterium]|nr:thiolase family protein [Planctomycetota bacterium]